MKSDREGEISYGIPFMCNLKRNLKSSLKSELTYKTERNRLREQTYDCWREEQREGQSGKLGWTCTHYFI